jgi:hypothetical protein
MAKSNINTGMRTGRIADGLGPAAAGLVAIVLLLTLGLTESFVPTPSTSFVLPLCTTAQHCVLRSRVPCAAARPHALQWLAAVVSNGPSGGFNARDFIPLQLIGADVGRQQKRKPSATNPDDCASIFLGPTLQLGEGGNVDLKSRLDFTDGTTASGLRRAVPIPITSELDRDLVACLRGYEALDPKRVPGRQINLLERGQAFIKTQCLHEQLPLSKDERRAATQRILNTPNKLFPKTPLDVALALWKEAKVEFLTSSVYLIGR